MVAVAHPAGEEDPSHSYMTPDAQSTTSTRTPPPTATGATSGAQATPQTPWEIPAAPNDPILVLSKLYAQDKTPTALNVGVGAYRDAQGRAHEFRAVRAARRRLVDADAGADHQYLPLEGLAAFTTPAARLLYGDALVDDGRVAVVQSVSGSGALRVGLEFTRRLLGARVAVLPRPSWANHAQMLRDAGLEVEGYRYYDEGGKCVDIAGMLADLRRMEKGSVVVLHPCAHNPTGADLTEQEWARVAEVVHEQGLVPMFDMAYQGFATGDLSADAGAVRGFVARGLHVLVAQSFSKNMGLYNSRVGTLSVAVPAHEGCREMCSRIVGQLKWIARTMCSSAPADGARLAAVVLTDVALRAEWELELREVVERVCRMRAMLRAALEGRGVAGSWRHVTETRGMFVCLGIGRAEVRRLREVHHVYMTEDSRINVAGLTEEGVERLAESVAEVVLFRERGAEGAGRDKSSGSGKVAGERCDGDVSPHRLDQTELRSR